MLLLQQEVGAHENRQGFIVSNVALLFEEQDVEILRCRNAGVSFVDILLSVLVVCT
jgi:hypothetical protein